MKNSYENLMKFKIEPFVRLGSHWNQHPLTFLSIIKIIKLYWMFNITLQWMGVQTRDFLPHMHLNFINNISQFQNFIQSNIFDFITYCDSENKIKTI